MFNLQRCFQLLDHSGEGRWFNSLEFSNGVFTEPLVERECEENLANDLWTAAEGPVPLIYAVNQWMTLARFLAGLQVEVLLRTPSIFH